MVALLASPSPPLPPEKLCEPHQLWKGRLWKGHQVWKQLACIVLLPSTWQGHLEMSLWVWVGKARAGGCVLPASKVDVCKHGGASTFEGDLKKLWCTLSSTLQLAWRNPCQSSVTEANWWSQQRSLPSMLSALSSCTAKLPLSHHSPVFKASWICCCFT